MRQGHKGRICLAAASAAALLFAGVFFGGNVHGETGNEPGYVSRLFDDSRVHTIDLQVEDWDGFLEQAGGEPIFPATCGGWRKNLPGGPLGQREIIPCG